MSGTSTLAKTSVKNTVLESIEELTKALYELTTVQVEKDRMSPAFARIEDSKLKTNNAYLS